MFTRQSFEQQQLMTKQWSFVEAPPIEVLGPIVRGYFITTEDKSAYIALQDPNSGKVRPFLGVRF